jgi:general bacterial porin, GBP family
VATMIDQPRADNVIQYKTPDFSGFWAGLQFAPHENVTGNDNFYGVAAAYTKAPIWVGASYEWNKQRSTGNDINKSLSLAAKYDFGFARIMGNYQKVDDMAITGNGHTGGQLTNLVIGQGPRTITLQNQDGYLVGAEIPWRAFTFGIAYTRVEYEGTPSAAGLPSSYTLGKSVAGAKYDLSKRTFLYADFSFANGDLSDYISQEKQYQVGIQHRF